MIVIRSRIFSVILFILLTIVGFFGTLYLKRPRIRLGEHLIYLNYRAKINPQKNYHLKLWDYQWPGVNGENWYEPIIMETVKEFERANPNIEVEVKLLDFQSGAQEFSKALAAGVAPDVYCSAYEIPDFNYKYQIPVGVFIKDEELEVYYPNFRKLLMLDKYLLTLPRWSAPGVWIGNRSLMEMAGLSVETIQKQGWTWEELTKIQPRTEPLGIANLSANGFIPQLLAVHNGDYTRNNCRKILDFSRFINGPLPQKIDYEANLFQMFLSGKVMFISGVRPVVYDFIRQKSIAMGTQWEPVLLPVPTAKPGRFILPVESGVIGLYRHKRSKGDDQLAAGARLAYYLSVAPQITAWERLKVVPAVPALTEKWAESIDLGYSNHLTNWYNEGELVSIKVLQRYQAEVYPGIKNFFAGKISRQEMEDIIFANYSDSEQ